MAEEISEEEASISISVGAAENAAKGFDHLGRDLIVHVDYEFQQETAMNFVIIDPVLYHTSSFTEVLDVATATEEDTFETVEGFADQSFDKILTPEANKIVNDDVAGKTFAPSNYSYKGLGVFTFPLRLGTKLRVTLLMKDPVPAFYERLHVLTQEVVTNVTTSKTKKKGL